MKFKDTRLAEAMEEEKERRASNPRSQYEALSLEEWKKEAAEETIDNDATWVPYDTLKLIEEYNTLLTKAHWQKVPAKDRAFHKKLKPVFPLLSLDTARNIAVTAR